ncbi:hypothetical protein VOLCADRAFT_108114 [Volvox carteri f. nagariensis]|uniref:Transcriptional regulator n=1 Tax=Volvox carteri f. nagariensis TaxID=3068 RepID=D8UIB2_VOLCA|nr:uncharacterized protein VOLCADRAFT_108114 [Volvox carteri f. nagariensis]EFJ40535.1 hypothetical protein VOLCADRAFT_108114 [Volvox carteri f. nagariensis]|eukprot:XP_002958385.1 hypothetical protein VOLCADRAFT_108114 [Volvox carteri f. nagariensis]
MQKMISFRVHVPDGRIASKFRNNQIKGPRPVGIRRLWRTRMVQRCTLGPTDNDDQQSEDTPRRPPHPEMDDSALQGSSGSSSIPDTLPYMGSALDWREFRAKLVSQSRGGTGAESDEWAHIIPKPEKGALLLAHPLLFQQSQTYFHRAAILLLEHGDLGSYGVILNRPSKYLIGDVPLSRPQTQFGDCRLYIGGDVGMGEVQVIHPYGQLSGAAEVVQGVYAGGIDAARDAVDAGFAQAKSFRWFNAYAGWGPGQLLMECKRGVWFTAAASPKLILQEVELGEGPKYWHKVMSMLGAAVSGSQTAISMHPRKIPGSRARLRKKEGDLASLSTEDSVGQHANMQASYWLGLARCRLLDGMSMLGGGGGRRRT